MKKNVPLFVIIGSAILMLTNFILSEEFDLGFWMRTLSSILIIIAMALTIRDRKKQD